MEDGTIFDSSAGKEALQFIIGENQFISSFEKAIIGMSPGESKTTKIAANEAYGPHDKDKVIIFSRAEFPIDINPEVGLQFHIERNDGGSNYLTVTNVDESSVTLDGNHPLAGKDIVFDIELIDILKSGPGAEAYYNLGVLLQDHGGFDEAISNYMKAIQIKPNFVEAYYNLGVASQHLGQPDKAINCYQEVIRLNPDHSAAYLNLGIALKETEQLDEAIKAFQMALQLKQDYDIAYYNLGNVYVSKGQFNEAKQLYQKTIELNPNYAEAHLNIAQLNLLFGNLRDGWKGFEWGWQIEGVMTHRNFVQPSWDGSDVSGRTILLYSDQGFGDTIHFIRYAPLVIQRGAKVVIECPAELMPLIQTIEEIHQVVVQGSQLPDFDLHCHILKLPEIFETTLETIPSKIPYIFPDPSKVKKWHDTIQTDGTSLKVGLVWSGDPNFKRDQTRSCTLELFSRIGYFHEITFYNLQKGAAAQQVKNPPEGMKLVDYMDEINDFSDTAALIENLDLVISVDTAIAHLTGALGKPVWTLLPFVPDWRWMLNREDSPWYPTMRLFRQASTGDWESVIDHVKESLQDFINNFKN